MPRMQSSLSPRCTTLAFHALIAAIDASVVGPSKIPHPSTHAYSVPDRFTPCNCTGVSDASSSRLPKTCKPPPGVGVGLGVGVGVGVDVGDGSGVGVDVGVGSGV